MILEAAERRLLVGGPEAIRLQEIAANAGISHPAILHHFGSREGLVEAMVLRGIARLQAQFLEGWPSAKEPDIEGVLERFYEVASRRGIARMLAWLILSGEGSRTMTPNVFKPAAERMHAGRLRRAQKEGRRPPELEETLFAASHLFILVLGDSLFGPSVRRSMDSVQAPTARADFVAGSAKLWSEWNRADQRTDFRAQRLGVRRKVQKRTPLPPASSPFTISSKPCFR